MKFVRQKKEELAINLTPLIDVVFLLLIFFMVSTTFTKETRIQINLPKADAEAIASAQQEIEVVVTVDGRYAVNGQSVINTKANSLRKAIKGISEGDSSLPMIISADAKAPHQAVVTAMNVAGQLGFNNLRIATKQAEIE